jgi:hypothetical protein
MTPDELAADRAICDAATPGPIEVGESANEVTPTFLVGSDHLFWGRFVSGPNRDAANDAIFFAAARSRWPAALDRVEELQKELTAAQLAGVDLMNQNRQLREQVAQLKQNAEGMMARWMGRP